MSALSRQGLLRSFRADFERISRDNCQQRAVLDVKTGRVWTYGALFDSVVGFSSLFQATGAAPLGRVFSLLPNCTEQFVACLAALWAGLDFCPISPLATAEEAVRCARLCRNGVGVVPHTIDPTLASNLRRASGGRSLISVVVDGDLGRYAGSQGLTRRRSPVRTGKLLLFTSGTTTHPKATVLDGDRLWSSATAWVQFHTFLGPDSRFYNILPMSYLGGLFNLGLIPLACQGSVACAEAFSGSLALRFWREVRENGVNVLWLSPTMLRALMRLHRPAADAQAGASGVRAVFLGMASTSLQEKEDFSRVFGIPVLENYALSETTFLTSEQLDSPVARSPGSVGALLPWAEIRLRPVEGPEDEQEIHARTPFLFDGYLDPEGEVVSPLTEDGFFKAGDLGEFTADGVLLMKGRLKDAIKKGGYLVLLRDLEEIAQTHEAVREAVALGVAHDFYGEVPLVCVEIEDGAAPASEVLADLVVHLRNQLAKFKWPEQVLAVNAMPRTESGKVQKWVLSTWITSGHNVLASARVL